MSPTRRYPLKGCKHLRFKYVRKKMDRDLDYWWIICTNPTCKKGKRDGGPNGSCFTPPYVVTVTPRTVTATERKEDGKKRERGTQD